MKKNGLIGKIRLRTEHKYHSSLTADLDLVPFTDEILNEKLHILWNDS